MSGSPVLNENGEVIGIHGRAETTVDKDSNSISTGNNLGIPINTFVAISSGKASNPRTAAVPN
jgi:serine protease Do